MWQKRRSSLRKLQYLEVENGIKLCRDQKEKRNALKSQISFRHKVLNQKNPDKSVFKFSHNRKQFSVAQVEKNSLLIIGVTEETEFSNCELQLSDIMLRYFQLNFIFTNR